MIQSYVLWALLGMAGYSLMTLFVKLAERSGNATTYMVLAVSTTIVAIFAIAVVALRGELKPLQLELERPPLLWAIAGGIALTVAVSSLFHALSLGPATVVVPIFAGLSGHFRLSSFWLAMDLLADMSETGGMWRLLRTASLASGLLLVASPCNAGEGIAARVEAGAKQAGLALAGPKPFVDIVCPIMQQQAEARGLPPMPFVRLIWKESRFNPRAVSPKGAQGIAQFMPGTAEERGLDDPFEPKSAIVHSASLLADLRQEFGNFGLAAAAYNAGAERVRTWLSGSGGLPWETQNYVRFVTGRAAEEWKLQETELPEPLKSAGAEVQDSCRKLAPLVVRAVYESEPLTASGAWRPWGVHVSTSFSKAKALAQFARLKRQHASLLGGREPFVLPERNLSRGRRSLYMVQIGSDSRADAAKLCARLRSGGGACIVQKN